MKIVNLDHPAFYIQNDSDPNGFDPRDDVGKVVETLIDNGTFPESDADASGNDNGNGNDHSRIYVVVTPPNCLSNQGTKAAGENDVTADTDIGFFSVDRDDIGQCWVSSGGDGGAPGTGTVSVGLTGAPDQFSLNLSHEIGELMSDWDQEGYVVNYPAGAPNNSGGYRTGQIGDFEGNSYAFRLSNGVDVQPLWSQADSYPGSGQGAWAVYDGTNQKFFLDPTGATGSPNWTNTPTGLSFNGKYALTIQGDQNGNADDAITVATIASGPFKGGVQVTQNGETVNFDAGQLTAINIDAGAGQNTVTIIGDISATVSVDGGDGNTTLIVKSSIPGGETIVGPNSVSYGSTEIVYHNLGAVTVDGGGNSAVKVHSSPFDAYEGPLTINGATKVAIGDGTGQLRVGDITIDNSYGGQTSLVVDDHFDDTNRTITQDFILANGAIYDQITPEGLGVIRYRADQTSDVELDTGFQGAVVNVLATDVPIALVGNGPNTTVTVGDGSLSSIRAAVEVSNEVDNGTALVANASVDPLPQTVTLDNVLVPLGLSGLSHYGRISFGAPAINYLPSGISDITVQTGTGEVSVDVQATTKPVTLVGNGSNTQVHVGNGSLGAIAGNVFLTNTDGQTALTVDGSLEDAGRTFALSTARVSRFIRDTVVDLGNGVSIRSRAFATSRVTIRAGTGFNTVNVNATLNPVAIAAGGNSTTVNVGNGNVANVTAPLSLIGLSRFAEVNLDNSAVSSPQNLTINVGGVQGLPLTLDRSAAFIDRFTVRTGAGADKVRVQGNPAVLYLQIETNGGNDVVTVGTAGHRLSNLGYVTVSNPGGTVILDDASETADRTYTLDRLISSVLATTGTNVTIDNNVASAIVHTGKGANTINVPYLPASVAVTFDSNGVKQVNGPSLSPLWGVSQLAWRIRTDGSILARVNGAVGSVTFATPIMNLLTGTQNDTIALDNGASFAGSIDAGGGRNTLDYSAWTTGVSVNLSAGTATNLKGISHIQNVIGGAGNDVLVGGDGDNVLVGGPGVNTIQGGTGRDLLIGGGAGSSVSAGRGEDVLVGGTTVYDHDPVALNALMAEWAQHGPNGGPGTVPYSQRVEHLRHGGGLNGAVLLEVATFTSTGGNTLNGSTDSLDLFYGSRARDHILNLNEAIGEVLVDPDAPAATKIDTSALGDQAVYLDHVRYTPTAGLLTSTLTPGQHVFYAQSGSSVYFYVDQNGKVSYDPALDQKVLSGQGTNTLTVHGLSVKIDTSALGDQAVYLDYVRYTPTAGARTFTLTLGQHVFYAQSGNSVLFYVDQNGKVSYDPALDQKVLSGQGTNTLTVHALSVTINTSALGAQAVYLDYVRYTPTAGARTFTLTLGQHVFYAQSGNSVLFYVDQNGNVSYDPALRNVLSGQGTNTLTVRGCTVNVNATALGIATLYIDSRAYDATKPFAVNLMPGQHAYYWGTGNSIYFTVGQDGSISYQQGQGVVLTQ